MEKYCSSKYTNRSLFACANGQSTGLLTFFPIAKRKEAIRWSFRKWFNRVNIIQLKKEFAEFLFEMKWNVPSLQKTSRRNNRTKTTYSLRMEIYWMSTPSVAIIESPQLFSHLLFDSFVFRIAFDVYTQRYIMHTHTRRCAQYKHTSMCLCVWVCARVHRVHEGIFDFFFLARARLSHFVYSLRSHSCSRSLSRLLLHTLRYSFVLFIRFHFISQSFKHESCMSSRRATPFCMWLCVFAL